MKSVHSAPKFGTGLTLMTKAERKAFEAVAEAARLVLALPELHPSERTEVEHEIHTIQMRLLARPGLRALGWKEKL